MAQVRGTLPQQLRSDQDLLEFPKMHDHAVVIVLASWCGACIDFSKTHLEGVKTKFMLENIPLGLVDSDSLSPNMQRNRDLIPSFPTIIYFRNGQKREHYRGERSPSLLANWVKEQMQA